MPPVTRPTMARQGSVSKMISKINTSDTAAAPPPAFLMTQSPSMKKLRKRPTPNNKKVSNPQKSRSLPTTSSKTLNPKKVTRSKKVPSAPVVEESPRSTMAIVEKFSRMSIPSPAFEDIDESDTKPELTELSNSSRTTVSDGTLSTTSSSADFADDEEDGISIEDLTKLLEEEKAAKNDKRGKLLKKESSVRWNDSIVTDVCDISVCSDSDADVLFYSERELNDFRYEAFIESCGLDPNDYD